MSTLKKPIVTEKATALNEKGQYAFEVERNANKVQIKKEIEALYGVTVTGISTIRTNGTDHPLDPNDLWLGDSRGHWEGDTLVVDAKHFLDRTWFDRAGNYHSDELHVIEYWKFLDTNTIEYKATIEDPKVFSRPWNISVILNRHREKNFQLIEDYRYTLEYDQYYPPKPDNK